MKKDTFANRLYEGLTIRGLKPAELSRISGISKSSISEYLKGKYEAKQDGVYILSKALNVSEAWLMGADVPMERKNEQIDNNISPMPNNIIQIPVIGKITAGQPILANEDVGDFLPVIPEIYGITEPSEYFYLLVKGDSMDRRVHDGDYVIIHKQDYAKDGDIIVAIVNGDDEATLKRYKKINEQYIQLEPMSTNPIHEAITIDLKETNFKIIGKAIGNFGKF